MQPSETYKEHTAQLESDAKKNYPCFPGQTYPRPFNVEIPMTDYENLKQKLDAAQKECIRIADLYRHDKALLEHELDRLVAIIDHGEIKAQESAQAQTLKAENETLKKMNADLQGRLATAETKLERILDTLINWRKSETPEEIRIRKGIIVELEKGYCPNRTDPTREWNRDEYKARVLEYRKRLKERRK